MAKADSRFAWETIEIKVGLLCWGLCSSKTAEEIYARQNPGGQWKTGNIGLHIAFKNGSHVLVTISHSFDKQSPYSLEKEDRKLVLVKNGKVARLMIEEPMLDWYKQKTSSGTLMPTLFLHEGKAFLHQAYRGCDYFRKELQCKFCGTGAVWHDIEPKETAEVVKIALKDNPSYQVCLGGGTRLPRKRDIEYFSACAREIRKVSSDVPIWVEMTPPESEKSIAEMVKAGVTSFGFNIEIWDDKLRKEICPGKSSISKVCYLDAIKSVTKILGPNRVGCCLLVGLEPEASSIEGALALTSIGAQPCMLAFKPWDRSVFKDKPSCDPESLIRVSQAAVEGMIKNNIVPTKNQGCLLCEGCTIDHDIYDLKIQEGIKNGGS